MLLIGKTSNGTCVKQLRSTTAMAIALSFVALPAVAQTWDGGGADAFWNTGTNWNANAVPANGGAVIINGAGGLNADPNVNAATNNVASTAISGGTVTVNSILNSAIVTVSGTGVLTINAGGEVRGSSAPTDTNLSINGGTLNNNGTITGALNVSSGLATNAGIVTGNTTISGGVLNLNAGTGLSNSGTLAVNGGVVNVNSSETISALAGTSGQVDIDAGQNLTIAGSTNNSYAGNVSGAGSLIQNGTGSLTLTGANAITGLVNVNTGTIAVTGAGTLATTNINTNAGGTFSTDGGALNANAVITNSGIFAITAGTETVNSVNGVGAIQLNTGSLTLDSGVSNISGIISGSGGLTISGSSITALTAANTYTGPTNVTGGILGVNGTGSIASTAVNVSGGALGSDTDALANTATVTVSGTGTWNANGADTVAAVTQTGGIINGTGTVTATGAFNQSGATSTTGGSVDINSATFTQSGGATIAAGTTVTSSGAQSLQGGSIAGNLDGAGAISAASGITNITGTVTNAASFTVSGGTVNVTGAGSIDTSGNTITVSSGTLSTDSDAIAASETVAVSGTGTFTSSGTDSFTAINQSGGTIDGSGVLTLSGTFAQTGGEMAAAVNAAGNKTLSGGVISGTLGGTGATTVQTGITTVTGTINGNVTLASGTMRLDGINNIAGTITTTGSVISYADATVSAAPIILNSNTTQLEVLAADSAEQSGIISQVGGARPLEKIGTGTLNLSAANTYTGATTVTGGTLNVTGSIASSVVTVATGATLRVDGGSLADNVAAVTLNGTGNMALTGSENIGSLASSSTTSSVTLGANTLTTGGNNSSTTFAGVVSGVGGGLTKQGTGTFTLSGNNTYTGTTTISGGAIQVGNGGTTGTLGTGGVTNNATLTINRSNAVTVANVISGTGVLNQNGTGNTTLSGANTYSGATNVNAGTLTVSNSAGLGTTAAGTSVTSGATLALTGVLTVAEAITLNGTGVGNGGALRNVSGNNVVDGAITLGSDARINSDAGQVELNGNITGTDTDLTVGGTGTTLIAGDIATGAGSLTVDATTATGVVQLAGNNSFTGGTTVSSGFLQLLGGSALADGGALTVNSPGTVQVFDGETVGALSGDGVIALQTADALVAGDGTNTEFSGQIIESGAVGAFTKAGTGTLILSGANTYTGTTTVNGGVLDVTGSVASLSNVVNATGTLRVDGASLADTSTVTLNGNGILNLTGSETIGTLVSASATSSVTLGANTLTVNGDGDGSVTESATFAGVISGTGGLTKSGTDVLVLSGTNTYTGTTSVTGGELHLSGGAALVNTGAVSVTGGRLEINASETIGSLAGAAPGVVDLNANTLTVNGDGDGATTEVTTFSGEITGTGGLTKSGTDILVLSGSNTFTGDATVTGGTLRVTGGSALADTVDVIVGAGGTFDVAASEAIASLATTPVGPTPIPTASVTIASGQALEIVGATDTTFAGNVSGAGNLVNLGGGTLTLTGANALTGNLQAFGAGSEVALTGAGTIASGSIAALNGGTITTDGGAITNAAAAVAIDGGGVFTISGSETIGRVTDNAFGPTDGTININGAGTILTLTGTGGNSQIGGVVATTGGGVLSVTGGITTVAAAGNVQVLTTIGASGTVINNTTDVGLGAMAAVENAGTFTANDGSNTGDLTNSGTADINASTLVTDVASVTNGGIVGGTTTIDGGAAAAQAVNVAGTITNNQGTVSTTGFVIAGSVQNADTFNAVGTLDANVTNLASGVFNVTGALAGAGSTFTNDANATLNVTGGSYTGLASVTNDETVNIGAGRTLSATTQTNNGLYVLTGGTVAGAFTNNGIVEVAGVSAINGGMTNAGSINLNDGATDDTLNVVGNLNASTGTINLDLSLNAPAPSVDTINVSGTVDGTVNVNFTSLGAGNLDTPNTLTVITSSGGTGVVGAVTGLPTGPFVNNQFLRSGNNYVIQTTLNLGPIGGLVGSLTASQNLINAAVNRPSSAFVATPVGVEPDTCAPGMYTRLTGGRSEAETSTTSPGSSAAVSNVKVTYGGIQVGVDYGCFNIGNNGASVNFGLIGGLNTGNSKQNDVITATQSIVSDNDFDSRYIGAYATYQKGKFFADVQAVFDWTNVDINSVVGTTDFVIDPDFDSRRFTISGAMGYAFSFDDISVVPSAGFSYSRTKADDVTILAAPGGSLQFEDIESMVGFASVSIAKTIILPGETSAIQPFVTGTIYNDFAGDATVNYIPVSGTPVPTFTENLGTYGEISAGINYRNILNKENGPLRDVTASVRGDVSFSDRLLGGRVTANLRLQF